MLKNTFILLAAGAPLLSYAEETPSDLPCCLIPSQPIESCQVPVGYLYPGAYDLPGCVNISVYGEFLYLELNRDGASDIARRVKTLPSGQTNTKVLIHKTGYRSAFKVGAAMTFGCDHWVFDIAYTQYHHTTTNHFGTGPNEIIINRLGATPAIVASALKSERKINLDFVSATFGRVTYFSERFILNPYYGLNSWWSSQTEDITFTVINGVPGTSFTKSGFWGIGPYIGIDAKGLLWCGTYIIGNIGTSLFQTYFNKHRVVRNFPSANFFNVETHGPKPSNYWLFHLMLDSEIGLGWGTYLCDCAYHVDFGASYYVNTSFFTSFPFSRGTTVREIYYQGLLLRGQFDF